MSDIPRQKLLDTVANLEKQRDNVLANLNGIAGAIQVLKELLADEPTAAAPDASGSTDEPS